MTDNATMVAVDGRDALAYVIVRPGQTRGTVSIEAAAKGLSKPGAAIVLRQIADAWANEEPGATATDYPATWAGGHALVIEYGDEELHGRCQCGTGLGTIRPDTRIDHFADGWERHVMSLNTAATDHS